MDRRGFLAAGALLTLAGCANPTTDQRFPEDDGRNADETPWDDGDAAENDALAKAQWALESAIDEIERQGNGAAFGAALDGTVAVDPGPIKRSLRTTREALDDARDDGLDDRQAAVADAIAAAERVVRGIVEAQPAVAALADGPAAVRADVYDGAFDDAADGAADLARDAETALNGLADVRADVDDLEADDFEVVEALSVAQVDEQLGVLEADAGAAAGVGEAVAPLVEGEELFWPAYKPVRKLAFEDVDGETLADAEAAFGEARDAASGNDDAPAFGDDAAAFATYARAMGEAARRASRVVDRHLDEFYVDAHEHAQALSEALSTAADAEVRDRSWDDRDFEYDLREYVDPELQTDTETWTEDGTFHVNGIVTNEMPYPVHATVQPIRVYENGETQGDSNMIRIEVQANAEFTIEGLSYEAEDGLVDVRLRLFRMSWG
ncbi:hypothetical protein [Salinilacihabitans rarus]|uniref:hypothetical protein n=1 Tax=Salinilacihabitans rarus TaxID=2961596 RepID=UPI0020C8EBBB|nr:hypothetical protein [Salinilacihabitans rarus]